MIHRHFGWATRASELNTKTILLEAKNWCDVRLLALESGAREKTRKKNMKWNLSVKDHCVILMSDYEKVFFLSSSFSFYLFDCLFSLMFVLSCHEILRRCLLFFSFPSIHFGEYAVLHLFFRVAYKILINHFKWHCGWLACEFFARIQHKKKRTRNIHFGVIHFTLE